MGRTHLRADARESLGDDGIEEADHIDAFIQQSSAHLLRELGIMQHDGNDRVFARQQVETQVGQPRAPIGGIVEKLRAQGVAVHKSFGTYVAEVVEITGNADDGVKIEKITCAVDCGIAVNPDVIKAQMEGGIGYGIGHVMRDQITLTDGAVDQFNFPDYEPLRISDIGAIETHIVTSAEAPTGGGEPGTPPAAPALANAIAASSALRVSSLPMAENGVSFV